MDMEHGHGTWNMDMDMEHGTWTWTWNMEHGTWNMDMDMDMDMDMIHGIVPWVHRGYGLGASGCIPGRRSRPARTGMGWR